LLKFVDNEATLAGIIAHEIGHAENRHSTKRMTKAYGTQLLTQLALGDSKNKTAEMAANLFSGLALLKNSRDDEYEADLASFRYLLTTGKWYPGAIRLFFDKIDGSTKGRSDVAEGFKTLLSTHPLGPDRVEAVDNLLKQNNVPPPNESNLRYREYLEFKKLLQ
jgi:predicted Zn-dependent protease